MKNYENQPGTMKTDLEPWKTMKNQPGTMKNHENQHRTMKNHENQTGTMKNQPVTMKNHEWESAHFSLLTRGHNWPFRCSDWRGGGGSLPLLNHQ